MNQSIINKLKDKVKNLPRKPGVYKFLDQRGEVLYVGKAKNLRARVSQYFGTDTRPQLPYLMAEAVDVDYTVVNNELESLFLENTLIKEYLPPYNIMLRDDKNYAFIKIDYTTQIPQISYARQVTKNSKVKYFGPFSSVKKIRKTLDFIRRVFPFCSHEQVGKRPCFYYHLHRCPGVCIGEISLEEYNQQLEKIALFLSGQTREIKKRLEQDMKHAARLKQFELAARLRNQLNAISVINEQQLTMFAKKVNWDFVSVYCDKLVACVNFFKVRDGKLRDKESFIYENISNYPQESLGATLTQVAMEMYYNQTSDLPQEIYCQYQPLNTSLLKQLLELRAKRTVKISVPQRGQKYKLINLGKVNAEEYLRKWQQSQATDADILLDILQRLKDLLNLPNLPRRIEAYDISNIQGTNPVGSMVVVKNGQAAKSEYRKFKINSKNTPDDFAMMREMLERRLSRVNPQNPKDQWPIPDLLVIDGGKGQLGIAAKVLKEKNLDIPVIGLAKRIEEIFLPDNPEPIVLPHDNPILQMLQRLRDEAHRFGITFHRGLRSKQAVQSALDTIPGIGPKTKKLLKQKIGTVAQIRTAPIEQLEQLIGKAKAKLIKDSL